MTSKTFTIRAATAADAAVLAEQRVRMFCDMQSVDPESLPLLTSETVAYFERAIPAETYFAWLAVDAAAPDAIIGGSGVQLRPILPRAGTGGALVELGPEAIILNVFTELEWRGLGVARAMMREILTFVERRGIRRIVLHASEAGRPLYEKLGFVPTTEMRYEPGQAGTIR